MSVVSNSIDQPLYVDSVDDNGKTDSANSSTTPLGIDGEFEGAWIVNSFDHMAVNVKADQQGTLYIEFAILNDGVDPNGTITDSDVTVTASLARTIYANASYFRPLVKMANRAARVRYVNGGVAQTEFALLTAYGNNLFPASVSADNELLVTSTEQERNVFVAFAKQDIAASGHAVLIDLSDTTTFPHDRTGFVDLSTMYIQVDRATNSTGSVRIGVITRIDGTNADVVYTQGVRFDKSSEQYITRDRNFSPSQMKLQVVGGNTTKVLSVKTPNITAINTGITLEGPSGLTITPAVGDVIISYEQATAPYSFSVSTFYHTEAEFG